jgi:hypothetical protein
MATRPREDEEQNGDDSDKHDDGSHCGSAYGERSAVELV